MFVVSQDHGEGQLSPIGILDVDKLPDAGWVALQLTTFFGCPITTNTWVWDDGGHGIMVGLRQVDGISTDAVTIHEVPVITSLTRTLVNLLDAGVFHLGTMRDLLARAGVDVSTFTDYEVLQRFLTNWMDDWVFPGE